MEKNLIGERIKEARGQITQKELAQYINVSVNTVARWERNEFLPSFNDIVHISRVTHKGLDWFAGLSFEDESKEKMNYIGDLIQWANKNDLVKIKAIIELLKK